VLARDRLLPLHHLVELVRHASFGFEATDLIRIGLLVGFALVMWRIAVRRMETRLID
jgi:ABC-type polysaccharide/polyol phosphate export permease